MMAPMAQLAPSAALASFMADVREALEEGAVPNVSVFKRFENCYDQRYLAIYDQVLSIAIYSYDTAFADKMREWASVKSGAQAVAAASKIRVQTATEANNMLTAAIAARTKAQNSFNAKFYNSKAVLEAQIKNYKGVPSTLSAPQAVLPQCPPEGGLLPANNLVRDLVPLAEYQLSRLKDTLGSTSVRAKEWRTLLGQYAASEKAWKAEMGNCQNLAPQRVIIY